MMTYSLDHLKLLSGARSLLSLRSLMLPLKTGCLLLMQPQSKKHAILGRWKNAIRG
ncbi:hypothetical protein GLYMA_07G077800v4 [Glycine max]|uniref:Uncharacterized protein n=1 Tax=Glycine max TaxID=3847 RepID=K7L0A5_SOYBN|nr:hypothetical protein GYH30_017719 [Glycine max]KRH48248.1 hypothetical protein GLYMA_07G077800v4 [Glycine max]